jgi:ethanolamine ammonia-lyase small subunit
VVIGDGLSAVAAQRHAVPVVRALLAALPDDAVRVVVATQARVALGDEIGAALGAPLVLVLLGERPGLSSPDSLGAYLTWAPRAGRADSERNCVSNIRPEGLAPAAAAARLAWLVRESRRRRVTGIALKDDSEVATLDAAAPPPALT